MAACAQSLPCSSVLGICPTWKQQLCHFHLWDYLERLRRDFLTFKLFKQNLKVGVNAKSLQTSVEQMLLLVWGQDAAGLDVINKWFHIFTEACCLVLRTAEMML